LLIYREPWSGKPQGFLCKTIPSYASIHTLKLF
jgi:hypothetical protein